MSEELARKLEAARGHMQVQWSDERAAASERGMVRKKRRRIAVRAGAVVLGVASIAVTAVLLTRAPTVPVMVSEAQVIISPLNAQTKLQGDELQAGKVHVKIAFRAPYPTRMRAGVVEVESFHGSFMMERAGAVWVRVEEGEAVVRWPGGEAHLTAGGEGWYPPEPATPPVAQPEAEVAAAPAKALSPKKPAAWKRLAEAGDFSGAYDELRRSKAPVRDEPAELLLSADVSRLSHHPAEAVAPLQQVLARHASDPRAPLAAFTLGRVLLDELGRPAEAADAFAKARAIAPSGPLADDALAREVEARSRAGDTARARSLAEEYLKKLPNGPRARLVRHHGGLE